MAKLEIRIEKDSSGQVKLGLKGNIDIHSYDELDKTLKNLINEGVYTFVINLSRVGYVGSAGIGIFLSVLDTIQAHGGSIKLVDPQPIVKKALQLLEASHFFTIG